MPRPRSFFIIPTLLFGLALLVVFASLHGLSFSPTRNDPDLLKHPAVIAQQKQKQRKPDTGGDSHDDSQSPPDSTKSTVAVVQQKKTTSSTPVPLPPVVERIDRGQTHGPEVAAVSLPQLDPVDSVEQCPGSTKHFSLEPPAMPVEFHEEMNCKANKINKKRYSLPKNLDLKLCAKHLPECAFWSCFGNTSSKTIRKCCYEHRSLRNVAWWVIRKLEQHNITYFLSTGTALGAIRHNGVIIPWDTDVDIAIFPEDSERVRTLFSALSSEHYFHKDHLGKQMFWIHHSKNGKPADGPHVEIFYEKDYTKHVESLLPLERCSFYGRKAWCPNRKMFSLWFGKGWESYTGAHYHDDGRCTIYMACTGKRIEKLKC